MKLRSDSQTKKARGPKAVRPFAASRCSASFDSEPHVGSGTRRGLVGAGGVFLFANFKRAITPSIVTCKGFPIACSHCQTMRAETSSSAAASACVRPSRSRCILSAAANPSRLSLLILVEFDLWPVRPLAAKAREGGHFIRCAIWCMSVARPASAIHHHHVSRDLRCRAPRRAGKVGIWNTVGGAVVRSGKLPVECSETDDSEAVAAGGSFVGPEYRLRRIGVCYCDLDFHFRVSISSQDHSLNAKRFALSANEYKNYFRIQCDFFSSGRRGCGAGENAVKGNAERWGRYYGYCGGMAR